MEQPIPDPKYLVKIHILLTPKVERVVHSEAFVRLKLDKIGNLIHQAFADNFDVDMVEGDMTIKDLSEDK